MLKAFTTYPFYKFIDNHFNKQQNQKNLILEPISCIMKLILLQHKEEGTKISVNNNAILFNEPSLGQGFLRSIYGDCREDLHNLYNPFFKILPFATQFKATPPAKHKFLLFILLDNELVIFKTISSITVCIEDAISI